MKILVISQYYYPEPFKVNEICEGLVKEGHKVTVITGMPNYPSGKLYEGYENKMHEYKDGVEIIRTNIVLRGKNPLSMIANYYSYPRKAKQAIDKLEDEYDIVYVYQLSPVMMIQPAVYYKQKYGKKILTYCLDLWPESLSNIKIKKNNPIYSYILSVANKLYAKCDHIMVTSPFFLEYLNQVNKVESDKLSINYQHGEDFFLEVPKYEKKKNLI